MAYKFNPFTGTFDIVGGASVVVESDSLKIGSYTANEDISALKIVKADDQASISLSSPDDYTNASSLGVALTAGTVGSQIEVLRIGKLIDASFNFTLNEPLFLTDNGNITNNLSSESFATNIGYGLGAGAIFIDIQETIQI